MSVLDSLPDGSISRLVREVETAQREIKAPQTIGSSGVLMDYTISAASVDVTVPPEDGRSILLQYTPSDISFGGGLVYRAYNSIDGSPGYSEVSLSYRMRVDVDGVQSWVIPAFNDFSLDPKTYKFLFIGVGSGTFTANLI